MIGITIPAHNEQDYIGRCLSSVAVATAASALNGEQVRVVVVLDDCSDDTGNIARSFNVDIAVLNVRNVGLARAVGAQRLLDLGARWLAFTDADSEVVKALN